MLEELVLTPRAGQDYVCPHRGGAVFAATARAVTKVIPGVQHASANHGDPVAHHVCEPRSERDRYQLTDVVIDKPVDLGDAGLGHEQHVKGLQDEIVSALQRVLEVQLLNYRPVLAVVAQQDDAVEPGGRPE